MITPTRTTPEEMTTIIQAWLFTRCDHHRKDNTWSCKQCGAVIQSQSVFYSIHVMEFSQCAGPGRVIQLPIPFCPNCETAPATTGCIHMPYVGRFEEFV